ASRAAQHIDQNATQAGGRVDQSEPTSIGLYLGLLEHADDSRPPSAALWCRIPAPLSLYVVAEHGLFLSEGALCVGSSPRGQTLGMAPNALAHDATPGQAAQGAAALWR